MQRSLHNDVEIYNITATQSLPDGISDRRRRKLLKRDKRLNKQVNLIHEFEMPNFSTHVTATPDCNCLFALGSYKPRVKCFEVVNMSEKFMRGVDALPHKIEFVGPDWTKFWLLEDDRWIEFHTQEGQALRQRIPTSCRDIVHCGPMNQTYIAGASPDLYRFCLATGRLLPPLTSLSGGDLTACTHSLENGLVLTGNENGVLDAWDDRVPKCVSSCVIGRDREEVSCLRFQNSLNLGVGLSSGRIVLFDIRNKRPRLEKEHHYGFPILDLAFHGDRTRDQELKVISLDKKCVKIWLDEDQAPTWAAFEPGVNLNSLYNWPNSGLLHLANEGPQLLSYFIPDLGSAPNWCSSLHLLVQEFDTEEATVFEGQKFVTRDELEAWGLTQLIGSPHLTAHLHGFHMNAELYGRLRAQVGPATKRERAQAEVDEEIKRRREAVAIRIEEEEEAEDERFRALANDPEFAVDPLSEEAAKTQRVERIKEKKVQKRMKAREKAARSTKMLES